MLFMEKLTISMAMFIIYHGYLSHYQRENPIKSDLNDHFLTVFLWFSYGFPYKIHGHPPMGCFPRGFPPGPRAPPNSPRQRRRRPGVSGRPGRNVCNGGSGAGRHVENQGSKGPIHGKTSVSILSSS